MYNNNNNVHVFVAQWDKYINTLACSLTKVVDLLHAESLYENTHSGSIVYKFFGKVPLDQ